MAHTRWSATVLGAIDGWGPELRTAVGICLNSPFPMLIMWGPDLTMIYNDAFVPILGAKHPALGQPCAVVWSDAWPVVGGMIGGVMAGGKPVYHQDLRLMLQRHGFDESVYFTFAYSAIPLAGGTVGGVFTVVTETTGQVLGNRRLDTLRELGAARSAQVSDVRQAITAAVRVLDQHRADVPFGAVYLLADDGSRLPRVASFGPELSPADRLPDEVADDGWIWSAVVTGVAQTRPALPADETPSHTALALPLAATVTDPVHGVVVLGVSADLLLDDAYRGFLNLVANHLTGAVTDATAVAAQLRRAEELAALDRAKTKFFTGVSHELRTPLTLIAGPAQDALADARSPLPPAQRERMEIIRRNAGRLRRMVDTLLDFSRLTDGRLHLEPVAVQLSALTRGIAQSFAPAVQRAGLRFTVDCPADGQAVLVDPGVWERIVLNLLSNAVKFTLDGEIRLALRIADGTVELAVADTGVGIAPDELPHIFERFRQVRGAAGRSHEGSGIGLALVRELAALHDGHADATSGVGQGTTITVRIPARVTEEPAPYPPAHSVVGEYVAEALQWSSPTSDVGADPRTPAGADTVLVVEDNADLRTYLTSLLTPGYAVTLATDGHAALREARRRLPDLVLADVMMPGLDGFGLLRALRDDPATARIPVVFLSARAGEEAAVEGLAAGADDYLAKPFSSTDLLARVRSNLDLARLRNHESAWRTALVNAMQDGFFVATAELTVIEINDGFTQLLGYEAPQLPWPVPHPWWPTADQDPAGFALVEAARASVQAAGRGRFVLPMRHRDGRRLWIDVSLDSLQDQHSGGFLLVGTLRDVTVQRLATERDTTVARLAELLTGINDSDQVLTIGLTELRATWQAERVSLLRRTRQDPEALTVIATTGPGTPSAVRAAHEHDPAADTATVGVPLYDGIDQSLLWLEFGRPRPFTAADHTLVVQLAEHLQRVLSRARANDEQRQVALALQRAILGPVDLPNGFAVRYEPASPTLEIGGDWYDVVALPGRRYGVVVGDVVGTGLSAATTMGQLRSAARALLLENNSPARVLTALDRFAALIPDAYCATVFCAVIDPATRHVRYSSAGHLPALIAEPNGTGQRLEHAQSVPLAVRTGRERPETTAAIASGSALLLYSDGLVERRGEVIDAGIDRAAEALAWSLSLGPDAAVDHICAALLSKGHHEDDVALLVYHQP